MFVYIFHWPLKGCLSDGKSLLFFVNNFWLKLSKKFWFSLSLLYLVHGEIPIDNIQTEVIETGQKDCHDARLSIPGRKYFSHCRVSKSHQTFLLSTGEVDDTKEVGWFLYHREPFQNPSGRFLLMTRVSSLSSLISDTDKGNRSSCTMVLCRFDYETSTTTSITLIWLQWLIQKYCTKKNTLKEDHQKFIFNYCSNKVKTQSHCHYAGWMDESCRDNECDHHLKSAIFPQLDDKTQNVPCCCLDHFCWWLTPVLQG